NRPARPVYVKRSRDTVADAISRTLNVNRAATSNAPQASLTQLKKADQGVEMIPARRDLDQVNARGIRQAAEVSAAAAGGSAVRLAPRGPRRTHEHLPAALGVFELHQTHRRQLGLARIAHGHSDQVVPFAGPLEGAVEAGVEKIAQEKHN